MHRLEITNPDILQTAVKEESGRSHESRLLHRLHCVQLVGRGNSCYQVAEWFSEHPRTVERWVGYFNAFGIKGLRDEQKTGRTTKIRDDQLIQLTDDVANNPSVFGYGQKSWDGNLLSNHLACCYNIVLSVRQCQRLLQQLPHYSHATTD